ncbi:MAG: histidinol-phosphatase HisJ family protein [Clostridia bacterium]|nr:histidinol-phosphatase HisJ family protein [Clostridia bacterium]
MRMKIITDVHTHTTFSADGIDDIYTMLARAKQISLAFWGISEHFDYDYLADNITIHGKTIPYTDAEAYFTAARAIQSQCQEVRVLVGAECGFSRNQRAKDMYHALIERYKPDFIVNSVHTQGAYDYYEAAAFDGKDKHTAYKEYLCLVRESLDVDYDYDIVGHLGYPTRFAPYADKTLDYAEFAHELDDILTAIIAKGKILELNSSVKGLSTPCLPFPQIVERYFALGGRKVSFASDAHGAARLADGREKVVDLLKTIGFTHITVPCQGKHYEQKI